MITNIVIEERELDGSYVGPIKVEVAQDLQVQNLDGLTEFKKEIEAIKDDAKVSADSAEQSATDAASSAAEAKTYVDTIASGVKYRGEWDASTGKFPTPTLTPTEQVDYYRIRVGGTMTNPSNPAQPDITVDVNDSLYWNETKDIWYDIESHGIHTVNKLAPDSAGNVDVKASDILTTTTATVQEELDKVKPWVIACQTKEQFEARRDENRRLNPASGFHDWGNHRAETSTQHAVNQGLYTVENTPNILLMGRGTDKAEGDSLTSYPRTLIAGVLSELYGISYGNPQTWQSVQIELPEAEKGLRTFDSSTGASIIHASAAEAFEGLAKNGNFREGQGDWHGAAGTRDYSGRKVRMTTDSSTLCYLAQNATFVSGKSYTLKFTVLNASHDNISLYNYSAKDISGVISHTKKGSTYTVTHTFTALTGAGTATGVDIRSSYASGGWVDITNIEIRPTTEEVVTRRVDMGGGEYFLRKITKTDSYVYPKGNIQSELATANGVATTVNTQRPSSYFDQYEGQNAGQKRGWDWNAISDDDKLAIVSDYTNLTYYDGKDLYQWCLRVRTFAGAGNGDWYNTNAASRLPFVQNNILGFSPDKVTSTGRVPIQGNLDNPVSNVASDFFSNNSPKMIPTYNPDPQVGIFTSRATPDCYFQVWFVVPRLNQGAYHPEFNEFGTAGLNKNDGWGDSWYLPQIVQPTATSQCFIQAPTINEAGLSFNAPTGYGSISSRYGSRHPGGLFYDAIYASGLGGVDDYRMTCKDTGKPEYVAGKMPEIINGNYRGAEKLRHTLVEHLDPSVLPGGGNAMWSGTSNTGQGNTSGWIGLTKSASTYGFEVGDAVTLYKPSTNTLVRGTIVVPSGDESVNKFVRVVMDDSIGRNQTIAAETDSYVIIERQSDITVSGEYYQKNIIGDPANILAAFPNGGYWEWIPVLLVGSPQKLEYTHPNTESGTTPLYITNDRGSTWSVTHSPAFNYTTNELSLTWPTNRVSLCVYKTKARQTKPTTNKAILHGKAGVGDVPVLYWHTTKLGRVLAFSLSGSILTNDGGALGFSTAALCNYPVSPEFGKYVVGNANYSPIHSELIKTVPTNDSHAVKFLWSQFAENKQSSIQFNWRELVHSGTNWGDDSKVHIVDNSSTLTDTNGTLTKVGTDELVKPLGYTW